MIINYYKMVCCVLLSFYCYAFTSNIWANDVTSATNDNVLLTAHKILSAVSMNDITTVNQLLADGIDHDIADKVGYSPLLVAAMLGRIEIITLLLEHGANPNLTNNDGFTALMILQKGSVKVAEILFKYGANPNLVNRYGTTALMSAIDIEDAELVDLLLAHGADPNFKDKNGHTPIRWAKAIGNAEIIRLLT